MVTILYIARCRICHVLRFCSSFFDGSCQTLIKAWNACRKVLQTDVKFDKSVPHFGRWPFFVTTSWGYWICSIGTWINFSCAKVRNIPFDSTIWHSKPLFLPVLNINLSETIEIIKNSFPQFMKKLSHIKGYNYVKNGATNVRTAYVCNLRTRADFGTSGNDFVCTREISSVTRLCLSKREQKHTTFTLTRQTSWL